MGSRYGLIGFPLSHSFSQKFFTEKFLRESIDSIYDLFPVDSVDQINNLLGTYPDLKGFNVTIPYKQQIIPFLNKLSEEASQIGAVNTVKVIRNENDIILEGYNTDAPAFESELRLFMGKNPETALILGTGGASAAIAYVLKKMGTTFKFVSRKPKGKNHLSYEQLDGILIEQTDLIVNCTPAGMYPDIHSCPPIPYGTLSARQYLFDLVYNPEITEFLRKGKQQGAHILNGLGMLHKQAEFAWSVWQK